MTTTDQFVYSLVDGGYDGNPGIEHWQPYPVVSRTARTLVIASPTRINLDGSRRTYRLDRARLETDGHVWNNAARTTFHLQPDSRCPVWGTPEYAAELAETLPKLGY